MFTVLGGTYRIEAMEPITQLCPERLCASVAEPRTERVLATLLDAMVDDLHVVTPRDLRGGLPSLASDWKDFLATQDWHRPWVQQRVADRRELAVAVRRMISRSDAQPTLYYLHALLPHEPFVYMRTGQQFTRETALPGLDRFDRWVSEEWPVSRRTSVIFSRPSMPMHSSNACWID